ncbi:MAG: lysylphosphatidylglycerol synthase transmembrane domain-containing protein, partial [Liquorilactobacillus satsumensis]
MTKKNKLVFLLMLVLGIAIFLFSVRNVSFSALVVDIQHLHWGWLIVAFCSMFFSFFLEAIVVKALLHKETMTLRWRDALRIPLIEQLFNGITPFSSGGQPAQLFAMLQSGADAGRATSVLLMKFVVYQSMIVVNFIFALLTGFHFVADKMQVLSLLFVLGFVVHLCVIMALLMIMYWYSFTKRLVKAFFKPLRWLSKSNRYEKLEEKVDVKIDNFYEESLRLKRDGWLLFKISCLTLVQLFFYYIIPYFILLGLGVSGVNFWMITTMHILIVMVISLFPIPGGSGGAEYSFSTIFSSFITNSSKLILAMILWRIITYY